jgi:hypothetical protein
MKPKLTRWISGSVKPAHAGVYQRDYRVARGDRDVGITYSFWNGTRWGTFGETPENAVQWGQLGSAYQDLPWRGLASDPRKPA